MRGIVEHHETKTGAPWVLVNLDEDGSFPQGAVVELRVIGTDVQESHWPENNEVQGWIDTLRREDLMLAEAEALARWCQERLDNLATPQTTDLLVILTELVHSYNNMSQILEIEKPENLDPATDLGKAAIAVVGGATGRFQAALKAAQAALLRRSAELVESTTASSD